MVYIQKLIYVKDQLEFIFYKYEKANTINLINYIH